MSKYKLLLKKLFLFPSLCLRCEDFFSFFARKNLLVKNYLVVKSKLTIIFYPYRVFLFLFFYFRCHFTGKYCDQLYRFIFQNHDARYKKRAERLAYRSQKMSIHERSIHDVLVWTVWTSISWDTL